MRDLDVKKIRLKIGYSQTVFAELLEVTRSTVAKWEGGAANPSMDNSFKMLKIESRFDSGETVVPSSLDIPNVVKGFSDLKIDEKLDKLYGMLKRIEESGEGTKNRVNRTEQLISETNKNLLKQSMVFRDLFEELEEKTKKVRKLS